MYDELGRKASNSDTFRKEVIAGLAEMCWNFLKVGGQVHMSISAAQLLFRSTAIDIFAENIAFQDSKGNERELKEAIFCTQNGLQMYKRKYWNFN